MSYLVTTKPKNLKEVIDNGRVLVYDKHDGIYFWRPLTPLEKLNAQEF